MFKFMLISPIEPIGRNLVVGPLQGQGNNHLCLAMHLWNSFTQTSFDEVRRTIECSNECFESSVWDIFIYLLAWLTDVIS